MNIIDLSMPVDTGHFRWPVERGKKGDYSEGDLFEASWLRTSCHGFTHMDAPRHMVPGGPTLDDLDLARVVGPTAVIDLSDIRPNEEITADRLAAAADHLAPGEIALFRTGWDRQRDWHTEAFWRDAPYMSRGAAEWLLERGPTACAFDFPQDYTIRLLLDGEVRPIAEHVTHDVLLRNNVTLIEYLVNTMCARRDTRVSRGIAGADGRIGGGAGAGGGDRGPSRMSDDLQARLAQQMADGALLDKARDFAADYLRGLHEREVYPSEAALAGLDTLDTALPSGLGDAAGVLAALHHHGSPATTAQGGGRYFGFVNGGILPVALAARWLADAWDQNAALGVMSPVAARLEQISERWLAELLGLPEGTAMGLVSGTSTAIVCGLAAARWRLLKRTEWDVNARGLDGAPRLRIVTGRQTHSAVIRAIALLGFGTDHVEFVDVDDQGRIFTEALPELDDRTMLILQAGNVNSGAFDPIAALTEKAAEAGAWVHIDGAFGLWAAASPKLRHLTQGMAGAQSFSVDAHKTLNVPYDSGIVLATDREALVSALQAQGAYLAFGEGRDGMSYTPEMSRRARGVELWATLAWLGSDGVAALVDGLHDRAAAMAVQLRDAGFEVLNDVVFNQVIIACETDALTRATLAHVQKSGVCWAGGSDWFGHAVIRISVCSWATTEQDIRISVDAFRTAQAQARNTQK